LANIGKKDTIETRLKKSEAAKGHVFSKENIEKMLKTRKENKKIKNDLD